MAKILAFPADYEPPSLSVTDTATPLRRTPRGDLDILAVAWRLRWNTLATRTIVAKLRALHQQCGFPAPINARLIKVGADRNGNPRHALATGADAITTRSLWDRDEVEAWCDTPTPAPAASPARLARHRHIREDMAHRAARIAGARA